VEGLGGDEAVEGVAVEEEEAGHLQAVVHLDRQELDGASRSSRGKKLSSGSTTSSLPRLTLMAISMAMTGVTNEEEG